MNAPSRLWLLLLDTSCATPNPPGQARPAAPLAALLPEEIRLSELRQLTFGGENAEAYWSFDGQQLSYQARAVGEGCDRIYRMPVEGGAAARVANSSSKGATT